jgi:Golgi nucleoside diphosphatase
MERSTKYRSPSSSDKEALLPSTSQSLSDIPLDSESSATFSASTIPSSESSGSLKMNQFLNNMSHRINSNKPKYGNFQSNFLSKARSFCSARFFFWAAGLFISGYIFLYYFEFISSSSFLTSPFNLGDRSSTYRVKILPSLLSDEELHSLPKESFSYLAMIDAGSSGCRAHIYRYGKLGSIDGPLYVLPQHTSKKIKPGLSSFAKNPNDAGLSVAGLIDFMKEQVPEEDWSVTPIWLKATAGLRMLPSSQSEAILDSVRKFLLNSKNSPFYFRYSWARIISGNEEGGFGWIAFNYLKKLIGPKKAKTASQSQRAPYAVIEMGGASAQVSQVAPSPEEASKIPNEFRFSFEIEGEEYHLYTHSYLGYGAEQAKEQFYRLLKQQTAKTSPTASSPAVSLLSKDPCKHEGFVSPAQQRRKLLAEHRASRGLLEDFQNSTVDRVLSSISASLSSSSSSADINPTCVQCVASLFTTITSFGTSLLNDASSALSSLSSAVSSSASSAPSSPLASNNLCSTPGPHSFGCVYQPDFVTSSPNILAFENFYYMSSALGVRPHKNHRSLASVIEKSNISDIKAISAVATTFPLETTPYHIKEASETFCALPWNDVQAHYPKDTQGKDVNMKTCFISAFSYSFLVDGLKIPHNKVITIQKEVDNSEIEWALGAAYKETADFLKRSHLRPT